eukprot:476804_1
MKIWSICFKCRTWRSISKHYDLLKPSNASMKIRDSKTGVFIENVTEMYVRDAQEVMDLMTMGSRARTTGATPMNAASSRSHGVFMLILSQTNTKSGTTGMLLKEAQKINQSPFALGNVMGLFNHLFII